ncbi:unnamed protein product, partial [Didymodactylos carnosus]
MDKEHRGTQLLSFSGEWIYLLRSNLRKDSVTASEVIKKSLSPSSTQKFHSESSSDEESEDSRPAYQKRLWEQQPNRPAPKKAANKKTQPNPLLVQKETDEKRLNDLLKRTENRPRNHVYNSIPSSLTSSTNSNLNSFAKPRARAVSQQHQLQPQQQQQRHGSEDDSSHYTGRNSSGSTTNTAQTTSSIIYQNAKSNNNKKKQTDSIPDSLHTLTPDSGVYPLTVSNVKRASIGTDCASVTSSEWDDKSERGDTSIKHKSHSLFKRSKHSLKHGSSQSVRNVLAHLSGSRTSLNKELAEKKRRNLTVIYYIYFTIKLYYFIIFMYEILKSNMPTYNPSSSPKILSTLNTNSDKLIYKQDCIVHVFQHWKLKTQETKHFTQTTQTSRFSPQIPLSINTSTFNTPSINYQQQSQIKIVPSEKKTINTSNVHSLQNSEPAKSVYHDSKIDNKDGNSMTINGIKDRQKIQTEENISLPKLLKKSFVRSHHSLKKSLSTPTLKPENDLDEQYKRSQKSQQRFPEIVVKKLELHAQTKSSLTRTSSFAQTKTTDTVDERGKSSLSTSHLACHRRTLSSSSDTSSRTPIVFIAPKPKPKVTSSVSLEELTLGKRSATLQRHNAFNDHNRRPQPRIKPRFYLQSSTSSLEYTATDSSSDDEKSLTIRVPKMRKKDVLKIETCINIPTAIIITDVHGRSKTYSEHTDEDKEDEDIIEDNVPLSSLILKKTVDISDIKNELTSLGPDDTFDIHVEEPIIIKSASVHSDMEKRSLGEILEEEEENENDSKTNDGTRLDRILSKEFDRIEAFSRSRSNVSVDDEDGKSSNNSDRIKTGVIVVNNYVVPTTTTDFDDKQSLSSRSSLGREEEMLLNTNKYSTK